MSRFKIILIVIVLALLAALPAAAQENEVRLTLERTACFGSCPVYTLTIYADGTVTYNGQNHVDIEGEQTINIGAERVVQLVNAFVEAGYFDWNDEYKNMTVTDLPYITTSVTHNGVTKTIERYAGDDSAPLALPYLENWLDMAVYTPQWTGQQTPLPYFTSAGDPVITLERGACFGFCPVYMLVLHSDGTVVYMGFDHVSVVGVRITQIEDFLVQSLAQEASIFGYFDWQDEYNEYIVTDHATMITSLLWEGEYKRILRYDGDPNAPIGLVRFEDKIDQAVNISQWLPESE